MILKNLRKFKGWQYELVVYGRFSFLANYQKELASG